jgi:hypothetical protein
MEAKSHSHSGGEVSSKEAGDGLIETLGTSKNVVVKFVEYAYKVSLIYYII